MLCDPPWELEVPGLSSTDLPLSALEPETPRPPVLTVYVCRELSDKPVTFPELEIRPESAVRSEVRLLSWFKTEVRVPAAESDVCQESSCVSDVG